MKTRISLATIILLLFCQSGVRAQYARVSERTWHAMHAGIQIGLNQSFHTGDVPLLPMRDTPLYTTANSSNLMLAGFIEKPFSRSFLLGLKAGWEPMSATVEGTAQDPFRIADANGKLYDVTREHSTEYVLRYVTIGVYMKIYPLGGPGVFFGGGVNGSWLVSKRYLDNAQIVSPDWAAGYESKPLSGTLDGMASVRASIDLTLGYELFLSYVFIAPQLQYNLGLTSPSDASWGKNWNLSNVRAVISFGLPLIVI